MSVRRPLQPMLRRLRDGNLIAPLSRAQSDSGMETAFRPAQYVKPQQRGLIQRLQGFFSRLFRRVDPAQTTEQGAASAASPSTYRMGLQALRYERRALIADCRMMYEDDPRCTRSVDMFAREAVRSGCSITVSRHAMRGLSAGRARVAQQCAANVMAILNTQIVGLATMLVVEGDLFVQAIVSQEGSEARLVGAKRMPASAMERLTDDTDEFVSVSDAFEQVDISTNATVATFALWQIWQGRWRHIPGERYGLSELASGRRLRRLLELVEEAQVIRRMARAPQRNVWNIGTSDKTSTPDEVETFKAKNGFVDGEREPLDPENVALDYFGNGTLNVTTIGSDSTVADIDDIRYFQNVLASTAYPTPPALMNLDAESVNRDVLKDQRAEWLKQTVTLSDMLTDLTRWLMDFDLMLHGIYPPLVDYTVHFSTSSIETPGEIIDNILKLRSNTVGGQGPTSSPDPMISKQHALQLLSEFLGIKSVDKELEVIEEEEDRRIELQKELMQANVTGRIGPNSATPATKMPAVQTTNSLKQ